MPIRFGLRTLIQPLSEEMFWVSHGKNRPFVRHGALARFGPLSRIPELFDVKKLAAAIRGRIELFGSGGFRSDSLSPKHALPFYKRGYTLYFTRVERSLPALCPLAARLAADLGVETRDVECEMFASKSGSGTGPHFDLDYNFNIQLKGRKRWGMAPNRLVSHPPESYFPGKESVHTRELRRLVDGPLPQKGPAPTKTFTTHPGSVVFVPRGHWHQTRCPGESLAISFVVKPASWGHLLLEALRRRLTLNPDFREYAVGVRGDRAQREKFHHRLQSLLPRLAEEAGRIKPEEIFGDIRRRV